jgi:hypothetical protein
MNAYLLRGSEGTYKPRSGQGWYIGSLYMLQSILRPVILRLHVPFRRMDSVQGRPTEGCLAAGGWEARPCLYRAQAIGGWLALEKRHPLPPTPTVCVAGS